MFNYTLGMILYLISSLLLKSNNFNMVKHYKIISEMKNKTTPIKNLPSSFYIFLIIAEDRKFFKHIGVDFWGIARAFFNNISSHQKQGASTIEQQLVRTITQNYEHSLKRKFLELMLALQLKNLFSKKEIIEIYLSVAYLGTQFTGIKKLNETKYKKQFDEFTNIQVAETIARLKYPEPYRHSKTKWEKIKKRSEYILDFYYKNKAYYDKVFYKV